ncbi:MAG: damage-inducible protein DinB [Rhodospirillales bacterium]|nr:damage-inducible protein DinB [Rhodospirillales bacterium]
MTTGFSEHFGLLAAYNAWANGRVMEACGRLSDREFQAPRQAFFGSISGTLNHVLVGDRSWLARLRGDPPAGYALDQILYDTFTDLERARRAEDQQIAAYVGGFDETAFGSTVSYKTVKGAAFENTIQEILTHMFNHQTHHRGQIHDLLSQTDVPPPELDLIFYLRAIV